jgi:hypothetical protein
VYSIFSLLIVTFGIQMFLILMKFNLQQVLKTCFC